MNIAFGLSLLGITLFFQFGKTVITTPDVIEILDYGYITETRLWVRIVEGLISLGLIALGTNRLRHYRKHFKRFANKHTKGLETCDKDKGR